MINHEMDKLLTELKDKIMLKLQDAGKISMCADIWSKKGMTASYLPTFSQRVIIEGTL